MECIRCWGDLRHGFYVWETAFFGLTETAVLFIIRHIEGAWKAAGTQDDMAGRWIRAAYFTLCCFDEKET